VTVRELRELNRTLLARQMLLERKRQSAVRAVSRLVALQAQYAPSPYVALWSRVAGFRKEHLTDNEALVKAGTLRTTLHVMARDDYPFIVSAAIDSRRGRTENLGVDVDALRRALPRRPLTSAEIQQIAERVLGTDDRWTIAFSLRALPFVRVGVVGPWPHTKPPPARLWDAKLPDPQEAATRVVWAYLAGYGPATIEDVEHFTSFRKRQIGPALEGLAERDGMFDVPRGRTMSGRERAPVRFLPAYDSIILAHNDSSRIVPPEYAEAVYNRKNATTKNTFTVDGFVAGAWRIERQRLVVEPFERLPSKARREVDEEGARLLAWYLS
jgi:Winged helix DNA-binding domain